MNVSQYEKSENKCAVCEKQFRRKEHLTRHRENKHSSSKENPPWICPVFRLMGPHICDRRTSRRDNMRQHISTHVKSDNSSDPKNRNAVIELAVLMRCLETVDTIEMPTIADEDTTSKREEAVFLTERERSNLLGQIKRHLASRHKKSEVKFHIDHTTMEKLGYDTGPDGSVHPIGDLVDIHWVKRADGTREAVQRTVDVGQLCGCGKDFGESTMKARL